MAQRFPVPNTGNNGPPPQRYPPSSVPPNLRQYSGPNFPVNNCLHIKYIFLDYNISWYDKLYIYIWIADKYNYNSVLDAAKIWLYTTTTIDQCWTWSWRHNETKPTLLKYASRANAYTSCWKEKYRPTNPYVTTKTVSIIDIKVNFRQQKHPFPFCVCVCVFPCCT